MNLVQINERLKDLPMQVLQQYANGMNPEVPPYLALGELQRREISQKQMATAQGGAQGPQPSVKEQVEQKAGLMALQQMQQQQAAQQMQQPRGPMPVPAGVPQPQEQPQARPEMMMARGGLTAIPVRRDMFEYAGGGIIAFSGEDSRVGSSVPKSEVARILAKSPYERTAEENATLERSGEKLQRQEIPKDSAIRKADEALRSVGPGIRGYFTEGANQLSDEELAKGPAVGGAQNERILRALGMGRSAPVQSQANTAEPFKQPSVSEARATAQAGPQAAVPVSGLPAAIKASQNPPAMAKPTVPGQAAPGQPPAIPGAPAAAPAAGLAAAAQGNTSPMIEEAAKLVREKPAAPTPEGIIAEQKALAPAAMQEDFMQKRMQEQRDRAAGERTAFEKSRPSGLDDLIRVFGQAGQYKGLSGLGPAYTANQQQKRSEDLAMEKRQNELLNAIDTKEYEGGKELFGARTRSMEAANKSYQDRLTSNMKALADLAGVDQRRIDEAANRLSQAELTKLRIAADTANASRPGAGERITAQVLKLKAEGKDKEAEQLMDTYSRVAMGTAAVGAESNKIKQRRQLMSEQEKIMKNESGSFTAEEMAAAAKLYRDLANQNAREENAGGNAFTVVAGGKTYTFPTQEAANKFKAEAGVK